jgi:membrane fusion protein (multidrug efflux system)
MMRPIFHILIFLCAVCAPAFAQTKTVSGITEPFFDVLLSSSVQGTIHIHRFKEGAEVKEGEVILELDSRLEELETGRRKAVMERNRADYESTRQLFEKTKAVSKDELDKKQMESAVATLEHDIAQEQLKRRKIVAPFGGSIVEIYLQPGASCEPYKPLVRLVDTKRVYFVGHIEGTAAAGLKTGQEVKIQVLGTEVAVKATISFIAPVVDSASGLAKVKALVENADGKIRPGLSAKMILE